MKQNSVVVGSMDERPDDRSSNETAVSVSLPCKAVISVAVRTVMAWVGQHALREVIRHLVAEAGPADDQVDGALVCGQVQSGLSGRIRTPKDCHPAGQHSRGSPAQLPRTGWLRTVEIPASDPAEGSGTAHRWRR